MLPGQIETLAKSSCITCRRQHKRCDKKLPSCGLCCKRRKTCVYDNKVQFVEERTKKRLEDHLPGILSGVDIKTILANIITYNMPVVTEEAITKAQIIIERDREGVQVNDPSISPEELGVVYYVYAMLSKYWGLPEDSGKYFEKARTLVAPCIDTITNNYTTAGCCCYLASYCVVDADFPRAAVYASLVKHFIDNQMQRNALDPRLLFIQHEYSAVMQLLDNQKDMQLILKRYTERCYSIKTMYGQNPHFPQSPFLTEMFSQEQVEALYSDICTNTNNSLPLGLNGLTTISNMFQEVFNPTNHMLQMKHWVTSIVIHGAFMEFYKNNGHHVNARREADYITRMIIDNKVIFKMIGFIIDAAANIHLEDFESGSEDRDVLLQILKDDYTAVKNISNSSNLWLYRLNDLKSRLEEVIWEYTNQQNIIKNQQSSAVCDVYEETDFLTLNLTSILEDGYNTGLFENEFEGLVESLL
ncbi:hypothetical protein AKO1_003333 [Acrasis kona]|uniref:Zn(2)-C6 fungal-type domain-containing protein n=1 Tax=Acrasis kona TaxID=1008807 RepID=A0AAW2Z8E2_9EUKA